MLDIECIVNVTAAARVDGGLYTTRKLDNPKNSEIALIVCILVSVGADPIWGYGGNAQETMYLLCKPSAETGAGTWHNIRPRGPYEWEAYDQLSDSLVAELDYTRKLQAFLSNYDVIVH